MIGLLALLAFAVLVVIFGVAAVGAHAAWKPSRHATGWALAHHHPTSPEELSIPFTEWKLDRPHGVRLCVWDIPGTAENQPTIVLLHGWSRSKLTWLLHQDSWRRRGSRIIIPDLRGHGDSTPDGVSLGDRDAEDITALLATLYDDRIVLVGRSLGSVVAIKAAATASNVCGVVAVAPYIHLRSTIHARVMQHGLPTLGVVDVAMVMLAILGVRSRSTLDAATDLATPLLIIHGTSDAISPLADAKTIANAAKQARVVEVEGAGHGNHWDLEPERLDREVESFIQSC